jgi:predicted Zn-dependent protease
MKTETYLEECLKSGKIIRWADSSMPLNFYIAPFRWYKAQNDSYSYMQMVHDALNLWQKASENKINFNIVNNLNDSQINLDWKRVDRNSLGHCYYNFDIKGRLFSAEIQIGLSDGVIHQNYQNKSEVYHTILHEIGHALGLGHSKFPNDIMYVPHQYGITNLSDNDKCTLKWLYSFSHGVSSAEILSQYGIQSPVNLDLFLGKLINEKEYKSKFSETLENTDKQPERDLTEEQKILAELNKYNQTAQRINLSPHVKKYIKQSIINKIKEDQ